VRTRRRVPFSQVFDDDVLVEDSQMEYVPGPLSRPLIHISSLISCRQSSQVSKGQRAASIVQQQVQAPSGDLSSSSSGGPIPPVSFLELHSYGYIALIDALFKYESSLNSAMIQGEWTYKE
jgi:hypothetical protein